MREYVCEFNRVGGDNIYRAMRWFARQGLKARQVVGHLTTLIIERPADMDWTDFKDIMRRSIQPRRGSVVLASETGRVFLCTNKGNQPGVFQRLI